MADNTPIIDIYLPTYRIEPEEDEKFYPSMAKKVADKIINEELKDIKTFDGKQAKILSTTISNRIREAISDELEGNRYKIVVQTVLGQMNDQGFRFASRALWNSTTDNYASTSFNNNVLFCTVLVAGFYID